MPLTRPPLTTAITAITAARAKEIKVAMYPQEVGITTVTAVSLVNRATKIKAARIANQVLVSPATLIANLAHKASAVLVQVGSHQAVAEDSPVAVVVIQVVAEDVDHVN